MASCSTSAVDFDEVLTNVADSLADDDAVEKLGKALGKKPAAIGRYLKTNMRHQDVTYRGTLKMLRDWQQEKGVSEQMPALRRALLDAGLKNIADTCLPPAIDKLEMKIQAADPVALQPKNNLFGLIWSKATFKVLLAGLLAIPIACYGCYGNETENWEEKIQAADPVALQPKNNVSCPRIVSRAEWGTGPPIPTTWLITPTRYAVVSHTAGSMCSTESSCKSLVKKIQKFHVDSNGWDDIGYNFLIGGDGNVYEGRGWNSKGAHARSYNAYSIGISMIGSFGSSAPSSTMMNTLYGLLDCAWSNDYLTPDYTLFGHRQASPKTESPGDALYSLLQKHRHYCYISGSAGNASIGDQCIRNPKSM